MRQLVIAIMPMRLSGSTIKLLNRDEQSGEHTRGWSGPHEALCGTVVAHHALLREAALAEREAEALQALSATVLSERKFAPTAGASRCATSARFAR